MSSAGWGIGLSVDYHSDDDPPPTRGELAREDAEPPLPQERRDGHPVVSRYVAPPEPIVHLGFDGTTTLCGQPWQTRVVRSPRPTCEDCLREVTP